jgi:hypothetical protein
VALNVSALHAGFDAVTAGLAPAWGKVAV